jgi:hypothetical protein
MAAFNVSLPNVFAALDEVMPGNIQTNDYQGEATALAAHLARQTARVNFIEGAGINKKTRTFTVYWEDLCDLTTTTVTDECTASSNETTDDSTTYALDGSREINFKESWKRFRTAPHDLEMSIAKKLGAALNTMDEYLSGQFITFLAASKGAHEYTAMPYGAANGLDWEINESQWTDDLVPHLRLAARFAKFPSFYLLDGLNLLTTVEKGRFYGQNDNGRGENALWNSLNYVWDPLKMSEVAPSLTFMVNPGSVAFVSGNYWDPVPVTFGGDHRMFTVASPNLPGVSYDVHELQTCSSDDFVTSWKIRANYKLLLNPEGCTADRTGVLSFKKVAGI